ncbi:MAG: hypothetical protein ACKERG_01800 [Candidatus Hodgkinia cicadicola]
MILRVDASEVIGEIVGVVSWPQAEISGKLMLPSANSVIVVLGRGMLGWRCCGWRSRLGCHSDWGLRVIKSVQIWRNHRSAAVVWRSFVTSLFAKPEAFHV